VPKDQWPERTRLVKEGAERKGWGLLFEPLDLAVEFDKEWRYDLPNAHAKETSKKRVNAQGVEQGTCVHLGNCDIGCDVNARNTLDLNYLKAAEKQHAEIRPLHLVRNVAPVDGGYRVSWERIDPTAKTLTAGSATARIVVLAAGSLGSTELLLRCREAGSLPKLSAFLGRNWSSNGDFLTPAIHRRRVNPMRGPTITSAINLLENRGGQPEFFIEDGGFPNLAAPLMREWAARVGTTDNERALVMTARTLTLTQFNVLDHVMPWFAQGRDAANGTMSLRDKKLFLDWDPTESERVIDAIVETHQQLAGATQGLALVPLTWTWLKNLITPHPLGGANIGRTSAEGVVDHRGEVFGYKNLFVADGAIVPEALGLNPSKTIAALAERNVALIVSDGR
jgi:cholesterol oxidase